MQPKHPLYGQEPVFEEESAPIDEQRDYEGEKRPLDLDNLSLDDLEVDEPHASSKYEDSNEYEEDPVYGEVSGEVFESAVFNAEAALEEGSDTLASGDEVPVQMRENYRNKRESFQDQL